MVVGVLRVELHLPTAMSLKDKRSILKSIKDRLRSALNVAVAEVDPNEKWQRATLGLSTIGEDRDFVEATLRHAAEWLERNRFISVIHAEQEIS